VTAKLSLMTEYKILKAYTPQYTNPIILHPGETVLLGEEEKDQKWKGWIWAESENNKGWIPLQILFVSDDKTRGTVKEHYSAAELAVEEGDIAVKIKSLNGWTWSKNLRTSEEGWIPDEAISATP
jgi:hypothetical protein